jgi:hypothetical protein
MAFNLLKRDSTWRMVLPGCYIDPAGSAHIFPDEILATLSVLHPEVGFDPNSKRDYDIVVYEFQQILLRDHPGRQFKILKHEREEH